jgi:cytoplasmic iron level regulating protein YaaA (DUF328/UPF0246 family)
MGVLMLLAPSKTMDFSTPLPYKVAVGAPIFLHEAAQIADTLRNYDVETVVKQMAVSKPIAESVVSMYTHWSSDIPGRPALWTYKGDVYKGMNAQKIDPAAALWAESHLLILSGLYGLLRPFDGIQRYRLEMKTALHIAHAATLSSYWGDKLAKHVVALGKDWICNLSSDEYARPVLRHLPPESVVATPVFFDTKPNGRVGTVPIYSKMMRGVFCRWMIDNRVAGQAELQNFTGHEYTYDGARSKPGFPAFSRKVMTPLVFTE